MNPLQPRQNVNRFLEDGTRRWRQHDDDVTTTRRLLCCGGWSEHCTWHCRNNDGICRTAPVIASRPVYSVGTCPPWLSCRRSRWSCLWTPALKVSYQSANTPIVDYVINTHTHTHADTEACTHTLWHHDAFYVYLFVLVLRTVMTIFLERLEAVILELLNI